MSPPFAIAERLIGPDEPTYVIAEISANHHQSYDEAERLVHLAKDVGADAVKLQTYTAATITLDSDLPWFQVGAGTLWEGRRLYDLYEEAHTPWEWQPRLKRVADDLGLALFSSPFDDTAVEFLEAMDAPAYKIASFEIVDHGLIRRCAATGKPLIVSTGMANLEEIEEAVTVARDAGAAQLALLHCNSAYPAPPSEMNLRRIPLLAERFGVVAGLSDHTLGTTAAVASVALGAGIVEKHFTLSRDVSGPDSAFSLEPDEFRELVHAIRVAEQALGSPEYAIGEREQASKKFRRSLFAVVDIAAGEPLTEHNVRSIRPADGLPPKHLPDVLGCRAARAVARGTPLAWEMIERS